MQCLHRACVLFKKLDPANYASRNEQLNGTHVLTHISCFTNEVLLLLRLHIKLGLKIYV